MFKEIDFILLDLDGTLVDAPQKRFLVYNTWALYCRFVRLFGPMATVIIVRRSIEAALKNNLATGKNNFEMMVETCHTLSGVPKELIVSSLIDYYTKDFEKWSNLFTAVPGAKEFIQLALKKNKKLYIWTNPIWPEANVLKRLQWAGFDPSFFSGFTHSQNMNACKPSSDYFACALNLFQLSPKQCLLIGDSQYKDGPANQLGIKTFILSGNKKKSWHDLTENLKLY